jgi:lipoprotein-anchoring transpeptidase ErfK/SrfK
MARAYHVGGYKNKRKRGKVIFFIVLLLQFGLLLAYRHHVKKSEQEPSVPVASAELPQPPGPAPAAPAPAPAIHPAQGTSAPLPAAPAPATVSPQLLSNIKATIDAGQLQDAQQMLYQALDQGENPEIVRLLGEVNMKLLLSPLMMPGKEYYVIQSGDYLQKIAKKFNTTIPLIKKMNGMQSDTIRLGDRLLVFNGKKNIFSIHVSKSRNELDLLLNGKLFKRYLVGTGKFGKTPVANFTIVDKISEPTWTRPSDNRRIEYGDPENLLGSRWMAIKSKEHPELTGFGIHGTWQRDSIGKQSSNGCIRMLNEEVEELFDIVPRGTPVIITE